MKIALCLHGLVGSTNNLSYMRNESDLDGKKLCAELSFKDWKRCVIDENDVDVFFHTWDVELEDYLVESYKPKKYQVEEQIIFKVEHKDDNPRNQANYSRFYGGKKVMELKQECEKENNFKYDCVIDTRFDLSWNKPVDFSKYDMSYFYVPVVIKDGSWHGFPHGPQSEVMDWIFFSNSEHMDKFSLHYDYLGHYNKTIYQWKGMSPHFSLYAYLKDIEAIPDLVKPGLKIASPHSTEWLEDDNVNVIRRTYFKETIRPGKHLEIIQ